MSTQPKIKDRIAVTLPPAKLNLFLELLNRREDGFHEIDTVMVPIDWRDELQLKRRDEPGIQLTVQWAEPRSELARQLGVEGDQARALLEIPSDQSNLVAKALNRFQRRFEVAGGFAADLTKRIPAGAGLGGASSDAAAALRCAAVLCNVDLGHPDLFEIAAGLGSDIPFFLGCRDSRSGDPTALTAARATGRGEIIEPIALGGKLFFVVVYPAISLSTAKVYSLAQLPTAPQNACRLIDFIRQGDGVQLAGELHNRLSEPAKKLAPTIAEILESLWQSGLHACQLTGSGSACFAVVDSSSAAISGARHARASLQPGALVFDTQSTSVPAPVNII